MKCPLCTVTMVVMEYERIELDCCARCGGVWFDHEEISLLWNRIDPATYIDPIALLETAITKEKSILCPICRKRMQKVSPRDNPGLVLDLCPEGHGIWFDRGEVVDLARALKPVLPGDGTRIVDYLLHVFSPKTPAERDKG